jgi:hypothetical protein
MWEAISTPPMAAVAGTDDEGNRNHPVDITPTSMAMSLSWAVARMALPIL